MSRQPIEIDLFNEEEVRPRLWRGLFYGIPAAVILWAAAWPWFIAPALAWLAAVIAAAGATVGGW